MSGDDDSLAAAVATMRRLDELSLQRACVGPNSAAVLAAALRPSVGTLQQLDLSHCRIGKAGLAALAEALRLCRRLAVLDLSANALPSAAGRMLADALETAAAPLRVLRLNANALGDGGLAALAPLLRRLAPTLGELDVRNNGLRGTSGGVLAAAIADLHELTALGASTRELGGDGTAALAAAQHGHRALCVIRVGHGERNRHPFSCHVE
jgi:Ran GTPase-activating protein (RanGAP) involved in mRNA processing and transport